MDMDGFLDIGYIQGFTHRQYKRKRFVGYTMYGTSHVGSIKGKAPARRFRQDEIFDCAHQKADQKSNDHVNDAQNHPGNQKEVRRLTIYFQC